MRDDNIVKQIKQLQQDIMELKSSQPIIGDSWILYRYFVDKNDFGSSRFLVFTQDDINRIATVYLETLNSFERNTVGFITRAGVHVFVWYAAPTSDVILRSTVRGTVSIVATPPFTY